MPDWDRVYSEKTISAATPADVLIDNMHLLPATGEALDYACGLAGNAMFLAQQGLQVSAWDLSEVAVEKINKYSEKNKLDISAQVYDLENSLPDIKNQFDVVVVSYFLHRESLHYLYDLLKAGGLLFYQTFSGPQCNGEGPARADFRLQKNELLSVFSDMQLLYYREDDICSSDINARLNTSSGVTYFVARK